MQTMTRTGASVDAIDMFCGYGGSSQGIHNVGADVRLAANHSEIAIDTHAANFPDTDHVRADISDPEAAKYVDPKYFPPARFLWASPSCRFHSPANAQKVYQEGPTLFNDLDPEFDHDLYAKSERSRVTMMCPLRYASHHLPEAVIVENVVEAAKWGPDRDGSTFRWWLHEWEKIGYDWNATFLNSMFFPPTPQSRDRMYVVFWRRGNPTPDLDYRPHAYCMSQRCGGTHVQAQQSWKPRRKTWPLERWGKYGQQYTYVCPTCLEDVVPLAWPAYSAIDWTNLGTRIGDRDRPLADRTIERIQRGLVKFANHPAFIMPVKSVFGSESAPIDPFRTQTTQQDKALVSKGVMVPVHGHTHERPGQTRAKALTDPGFTLQATGTFGFAHTPFLTEMRGGGSIEAGQRPVTDPAHTITAGGFHHGLATPPPAAFAKQNGGPTDTTWHLTDEPLNAITGRDTTGLMFLPWIDQYRADPTAITEQLATVMTRARHALAAAPAGDSKINIEDVRFRMLEPEPEIQRAMAFHDEYILLGNKTQKIAGLGNAVTPPVAEWLTARVLGTLG